MCVEMSKVYVDKSVIECMRKEIDKVCEKEIETGGIILGRNSEKEADIIISHIIDGGYNAERKRRSFKKDIKYSKKMENKIFKKYGFYYIGEWHTHPNNNMQYSLMDMESMISISNNNLGYKMIFIISGNDYKKPFKIYCYNQTTRNIEELTYEVIEVEKILKRGE